MGRKVPKGRPWDFLEEYRNTMFSGAWPTVVEMFDISVRRFSDNTCFTAFTPKPEQFTYTEAHTRVMALSAHLVENGAEKGERIAVCGKNSPEWAIAYLAVLYAGAVVVPLDNSLHEDDLEKLMAFAGVHRLFADADRVSAIDKENKLGLVERISLEPDGGEDCPFLLDCLSDAKVEAPHAVASDVAAILFTSGTTGTPKGVMLTHENLVADTYLAQGNMWLRSDDVFYAILPIHHAYTMIAVFIEAISVGASVVFGKKLVISQVLKEMREGKVTMFLGVPMLFNKMISALMKGLRAKGPLVYGLIRFLMGFSGFVKKVFKKNIGKSLFGFLLRKLSLETNRICISGGGPLPASTFKLFNELGIDFVQGYGLTETSPITHLNPVEAYIETSVGKVIPQTEVKIVSPDDDGNGTIFIKGPQVMKGYYNNPEATAEVLHDGWLNTGDVGHEDARHYLYLTGRAKNLIVTEGGKNVFPEEIEDHFQLYDEIETICILGYMIDKKTKSEGIRALIHPSEQYRTEMEKTHGGRAKAEIEKRMNAIVSEVNKGLQSYKKIARVTVVDEPLAMTSTRKIKRFVVAQKYKD